MTSVVIAFREETTADTYAKAYNDKVRHAVSTTESMFTKGWDMSIVCKSYSQAYSIAKHNCQRNDTFPRQIGSILYTAGNRAGARTADTDRTDGLVAAIVLNEHHELVAKCCHEVVDIRIVFCWERLFRQYVTTNIDDGISR